MGLGEKGGAGVCRRSNLILFVLVLVLVLVNQNFLRDEYDDEGGSCRGYKRVTLHSLINYSTNQLLLAI